MLYKVFLVEDEIVTREGIRDNVDWKANGFQFCGEAPDGEMALPLLQSTRPDVLITDIRMPFMDGLQLSQIVRERLPATKIIILSGHDEFEYAQKAIKLGVSEYLLKPVAAEDLHNVLSKVASELERERKEQAALQELRAQVEENRAALRERFLHKLVSGAASFAEAIEKSQLLGIDLVARCYLVVVARVEPPSPAQPSDYREYQRALQAVSGAVENNPDVFLFKKDMEELVLIMKGTTPEYLQEEKDLLLDRIKREVEPTGYKLVVGSGAPQTHIADIGQSFLQAMVNIQAASGGRQAGPAGRFDKAELLKVDMSTIEEHLRFGAVDDFDSFFVEFVRPLGEAALGSPIVKNYILMDLVLATARFVDELGGDIQQVIPVFDDLETVLARIETVDQLREQAREVLVNALVFRDGRNSHRYAGVVKQAHDYIDQHYMDPDMSLNGTAAQVGLSPSHLSAVFSQETGQTFKEYLTEIRIKKAKELLRTTTMKASEICYRVGYSDPHYFSHVFRKNTGLTPREFRQASESA